MNIKTVNAAVYGYSRCSSSPAGENGAGVMRVFLHFQRI